MIVNADELQLSSIQAMNATSDTKLTKNDAERLLQELVEQDWLKMFQGSYMLGVRTMSELVLYLSNTYGDVLLSCEICHNLLLEPHVSCPNEECETHLHKRCRNEFFTRMEARTCPVCSTAWPTRNEQLQARFQGSPSTGTKRSR